MGKMWMSGKVSSGPMLVLVQVQAQVQVQTKAPLTIGRYHSLTHTGSPPPSPWQWAVFHEGSRNLQYGSEPFSVPSTCTSSNDIGVDNHQKAHHYDSGVSKSSSQSQREHQHHGWSLDFTYTVSPLPSLNLAFRIHQSLARQISAKVKWKKI